MKNLKQKSIDGVIWTLIEKIGIQFIKVILGVILARLLTPADYGLIGMITVFFAIAMVFIDSGFGLAYIQKQDTDQVDASTIFYFNLSVSSLFYGILWFCAPLIAAFYSQPELVQLIRVMSIVLVINSFGLIQVTQLKKDVNFKKKTILILISAVLATSSGIIAALLDYGVWSLVIQEVVRATVKSILLWTLYKWRPLFSFSYQSLQSMFSFSLWSLFIGIIRTVFDNIYILTIGKFFPVAELGFFTKGKQFQGLISQQASRAVGTVAFPVFSKLQTDKNSLKNAVKKFEKHTLFFVAPLTALFIVIAHPFFLILLTEKWLPMVPYFQLLLVAGIFYPINMINVQVLSAQGKMRLNFKLSLFKNLFRVINIFIMYRFGVIYIIYGEIIISFLSVVLNTIYTKKFVDYGLFEQLKDLSTLFLITIMMTLSGLFLIQFIDNPYLKIILISLYIGSFYFTAMYYFSRKLLFDNIQIVKKKILKR